MIIFDRKFLQYQFALLNHQKYKNKILFINIVLLGLAAMNRDNLLLAILPLLGVASLFFIGWYLFNKECLANEDSFEKLLQKHYKKYKKQSENRPEAIALKLQKISFEIELGDQSVDEGIEAIKRLVKQQPDLKRVANSLLLSLYAYKAEKHNLKIPGEYIDYLDRVVKNEVNANILVDYAKNALKIGEFDKVISIIHKVEQELNTIKKIRKPAFRALYKTILVSSSYYKAIAYAKTSNKTKASESIENAYKNCKSIKLKDIIASQREELNI